MLENVLALELHILGRKETESCRPFSASYYNLHWSRASKIHGSVDYQDLVNVLTTQRGRKSPRALIVQILEGMRSDFLPNLLFQDFKTGLADAMKRRPVTAFPHWLPLESSDRKNRF